MQGTAKHWSSMSAGTAADVQEWEAQLRLVVHLLLAASGAHFWCLLGYQSVVQATNMPTLVVRLEAGAMACSGTGSERRADLHYRGHCESKAVHAVSISCQSLLAQCTGFMVFYCGPAKRLSLLPPSSPATV